MILKAFQNICFILLTFSVLPSVAKAQANAAAKTQFELANSLFDKRDFPGAVSAYNQTIQLDPSFPEAYNQRGNAKAEIPDLAGAVADYQQAIKLKPDFFEAYFNLALAQIRLNDLKGAVESLDHVIAINPNLATAYYSRAIAQGRMGDNGDAACADLKIAVRLDPNNDSYKSFYQRNCGP